MTRKGLMRRYRASIRRLKIVARDLSPEGRARYQEQLVKVSRGLDELIWQQTNAPIHEVERGGNIKTN